jgi:chromosome segregation ATPase
VKTEERKLQDLKHSLQNLQKEGSSQQTQVAQLTQLIEAKELEFSKLQSPAELIELKKQEIAKQEMEREKHQPQ